MKARRGMIDAGGDVCGGGAAGRPGGRSGLKQARTILILRLFCDFLLF